MTAPSTLTLKMSLTGPAFQIHPAAEVARILHNVAERIATGQPDLVGEFTLRDRNAMDVGTARFGDVNVDLAEIVQNQGEVRACGCGWPMTEYEGDWLHVFNDDLTGTSDHEPSP